MGLRKKSKDKVMKTHRRYFRQCYQVLDAYLFENVCEYDLKQLRLPKSWKQQSVRVDPRTFGLGCARARLYVIAYNTEKVCWSQDVPCFADMVACLAARPCLGAGDYFCDRNANASSLTQSEAKKRFMTADEMFQSHVLATNKDQASCGSPVLARSHLSRSSAVMLAGNAMNVPCVGAALLAAILALQRV
ncbi:unnamed protein product [Symbiodinium sp. CCMP2592]|nr:unnamed protein product [Symbiodinium sp. CCMP2592]CAE7239973.1 unnamed protein product [Symbiodinium sp. CCMP2592]CAE7445464.1 unnamed protein product [Symbiodinium sp. CCMP2592]CAE7450115.1 unnamed protein product [Symbiodinium sp. CCMP2592]CAE7450148.1 unnamed protein product [Symbiodinium sp. CCMP2592]